MALATAPVASGPGRVPPHDMEAEQSVLGSVLLDPDAIDKVATFLRPHDFYRKNHEDTYRACLDLLIKGEPIDIVTVGAELEAAGILERTGGRAYLAQLESIVPTSANIEHYGRIVREKSIHRRAIQMGGDIAGVGYDEALGADQVVSSVQSMVFSLSDDMVTPEPEPMLNLLSPYVKELTEGTAEAAIPSGLASLDALTGGYKPGQLWFVAGRPGMGKTAMMLNNLLSAAKGDVPAAVFSLEMTKGELVNRFVAQEAKVEAERLDKSRRGQVTLDEDEMDRVMQAIGPLGNLPLWIDDQGSLTDAVLTSKIRRIVATKRTKVVAVDYLGLLKSAADTNGNRVQEVGEICHALKNIAKELRIVVLCGVQLNRGPEMRTDKRPMLADLRESGDIEQDADGVIGMFREWYYDKTKDPHAAEAIILKARSGRTGTAHLGFREEFTKFYSTTYRPAAKPVD
jgi:replicative DNA helicase